MAEAVVNLPFQDRDQATTFCLIGSSRCCDMTNEVTACSWGTKLRRKYDGLSGKFPRHR